jgi:hypothetical protein
VETASVFGVGEWVKVVRDLPSIRAGAEGTVRGVSANASGITYAIRFAATMRIVSERDLGANDETSRFLGSGGDWLAGEHKAMRRRPTPEGRG